MNWPWLVLLLLLFCIAGRVLLQRRRLLGDLQSLDRRNYTLALGEEHPATAAEWLSEEYVAAGLLRIDSAEQADSWILYRHAELPVAGLDDPVRGVIRLYSFVADSGMLLTTSLLEGEDRLMALARQQVRLVQLRPGGTLGALHGQHRGTLQAWLQAGRSFEPVTPADVPALLQREVEHLTEELRRQPAEPLALVLASLTDRFPRLMRF